MTQDWFRVWNADNLCQVYCDWIRKHCSCCLPARAIPFAQDNAIERRMWTGASSSTETNEGAAIPSVMMANRSWFVRCYIPPRYLASIYHDQAIPGKFSISCKLSISCFKRSIEKMACSAACTAKHRNIDSLDRAD